MKFRFIALLIVLPALSYSASNLERELTLDRIKPVGKVRLSKSTEVKPPEETGQKEENGEEKTNGQKIYDKYCFVCHQNGVAGAPKFRDEAEWQPRIEELGIDGLTRSAIKGKNAMPAKGTCMDCSDQDIKEAVIYMVGSE